RPAAHLILAARTQRRRDVLRNREVDVRFVVHSLQRRQQRARLQELPRMHVRNANTRAERRTNRLARDDRLETRDLRQSDVTLRSHIVELDRRHRLPHSHPPPTLERRLRQLRPRLPREQRRLPHPYVPRTEPRARLRATA